MAPSRKASNGPTRRSVDGWTAVSSFTLGPDERMISGEDGAYRVAPWDARGTLAWDEEIAKPGRGSRYEFETFVHASGGQVAVLAKRTSLTLLDVATGKRKSTLELPKDTRNFALSPDGKKVVFRLGTATLVCT